MPYFTTRYRMFCMRPTMKIQLLLFCLMFLAVQLHAQKLNFEYLTVKEGLPQNTVRSIVKDKYGFMWFGTWNGLCRYDGYTFKVYRTIPGDTTSIANSRIHHIYKDSAGTLWVTSFANNFSRYNYETDNFTRFKVDQLPRLIRDSTNRINSLRTLEKNAGFLQQHLGPYHLSETKEHFVFETTPNTEGGINDNNVNCVYQDDHGILWLGTSTGGVNKADLKAKPFNSFSITAKNKTSVNTPVRAIWADAASIWLGTQDDGVLLIDRKTNTRKWFREELTGTNVRSLFKDSHGNVWIGDRLGLDRYDTRIKKMVHCFSENFSGALQAARFYGIAEDPVDHSVWFCSYEKLIRFDPVSNTFESRSLGTHYGKSGAGCLFFDTKNNLWIGTDYSGLIQVKRDPVTHVFTDTIDFHEARFNPIPTDDRVYSVTEDEFGNIWAGSANGLYCIDAVKKQIKVFTKQDGLSDQYIAMLFPDKKGNLWISHKNGISRLAIKTGDIRNYAVKESFHGYEFMESSGCIDTATGEIYFGGIDGFVSFMPGDIANNPHRPVVTLTALQVLNKPVGIGQPINDHIILSTAINLAKQITLTHADRSFSIEFAALHFSNSEKNQYAYRLEGLDKDWLYVDASRRVASYSNLPAGKYTFQVKAANSDGLWNQTPTTLEIIVLPPWWLTTWAYVVYILLLLLAVYIVYRIIRARHQYNQQILAERLKAEKALELDQMKSRFFTNVSHEFRTPLTLIIDPLESLLTDKIPAGNEKEYYNIMHRNARRLLSLINQFLDFRKLESGNLHLHATRQDMVAFVRNIMGAFEFQARQRNIQFPLQTNREEIIFGFDADVAGKILYNLISNAFKFTGEGGRIAVSITTAENPDQLVLTVSDNGIGIPPQLIAKIFEPFYQVESSDRMHAGGTGVGLSLTRELVTLHKGSITVTSEPHKETRFTVTLGNLEESAELLQDVKQPAIPPIRDNYAGPAPAAEEQAAATGTPVVLIVEDNDDVRNYLRMNLSATYNIIEATNGVEGLKKAGETVPDLIISDIMMPGMNGLELCKNLKTDEKTSHIPVILLTARQSDQSQMEGYETGADAYITKPFSSALLLVRIKNLLESRRRLRELFNSSTGFDTHVIATNTADRAFLDKATALIEENMSHKDVNVEWLAGQLLLSRTQLYRKIKALTDQSVHEFVTTIRLNKAAQLLLEGQHSVGDIAFMVGYADSTSFSRMFQKQFKQTPKKFALQGGAADADTKHE
jgi:signal transduction histidine kinase/DNA-binding response OmpR family regulator/ligand-binding sensor domain-containing protein